MSLNPSNGTALLQRVVQTKTTRLAGACHPFLEAFSQGARRKLTSVLVPRDYSPGEYLFQEGDPGDAIYLVLKGEVEIVLTAGKQQKLVAVVQTGDYFGEVAVLDGRGRSTAARARGHVSTAKVPAVALLETLAEEPGIAALNLFCHSIGHLRKSNGLVVEEVVHKEKLSLLGEMASALMHDLRSPLTCISMSADLMDIDRSEQAIAESCEHIRLQCQRISAMASDLLEFSRGESKLEIKPTNTERFLQQFQALNQQYLKRISAKVSFDPRPADVAIDSMRMLRVLQNLFSNAVEAVRKVPVGQVRVEAWVEESALYLTVSDNGPGIPREIRDRLFEPFVTHGKKGGIGLGMAIVKSIVSAHGGTLTFESSPENGTQFLIEIPQSADASPLSQ